MHYDACLIIYEERQSRKKGMRAAAGVICAAHNIMNTAESTGEVQGSNNFFALRLCIEKLCSLAGFFDVHTDIM